LNVHDDARDDVAPCVRSCTFKPDNAGTKSVQSFGRFVSARARRAVVFVRDFREMCVPARAKDRRTDDDAFASCATSRDR